MTMMCRGYRRAILGDDGTLHRAKVFTATFVSELGWSEHGAAQNCPKDTGKTGKDRQKGRPKRKGAYFV